MSKQKKKHKKTSPAELTPAGEVKAKRFNYKQALLILTSTLAAFVLYEALIITRFLPIGGIPVIMPVFYIVCGALTVAVIFLNHGFSVKPVTPDMLEGLGDGAELIAACERINRQKKTAKRLMLVLLPFLLSVFLDIIYLFYGDMFLSLISSLAGGNG